MCLEMMAKAAMWSSGGSVLFLVSILESGGSLLQRIELCRGDGREPHTLALLEM